MVSLRAPRTVFPSAAITRHPDQGDRDLPLVRAIRDYRGLTDTELGPGKVVFGVYARVVTPGTLRAGEDLRLL